MTLKIPDVASRNYKTNAYRHKPHRKAINAKEHILLNPNASLWKYNYLLMGEHICINDRIKSIIHRLIDGRIRKWNRNFIVLVCSCVVSSTHRRKQFRNVRRLRYLTYSQWCVYALPESSSTRNAYIFLRLQK